MNDLAQVILPEEQSQQRVEENLPAQRAEMRRVFAAQQQTALKWRHATVAERIERIKRLKESVLAHRQAIYDALYEDLRKSESEVDIAEIMVVVQDANHAIRHLKQWAKPQRVPATKALNGTFSKITYQPKGVCLIIAPWNFPVNLMLGPLISALAAGNTAILKPSEMTPATSNVLEHIIDDVFDEEEVAIFQGAAETSQALLELKFDHCFFTGSPQVGKIVMGACAKNLTSITLELGGKSPAVLDSTVNMKDAAGSIAFGKCSNAGQICIAPDYMLMEKSAQADFVREYEAVVKKRYGEMAELQKASPFYTRIINENHVRRIQGLLDDAVSKGAKIAVGGEVDIEDRYIQPTVLVDVPRGAKILEEEIFGPVLPIVTWEQEQQAIDYINAGEKPLALYVYSKNDKRIQNLLTSTSSGDAAINTCLVQFLNHNVPFGGANNSGIGNSHGVHGFKAFSHERGVVRDRFAMTQLFAAPYTPFVKRLIKFAVRWLT